MKTIKKISGKIKVKTAIFITLIALTALTGCAGTKASMDMATARANGNINKSEKISAHELEMILDKHFGKVNVKLTDYEYALPDNGKVVELSDTSSYGAAGDGYASANDWDCDDYAIAAMVPLRNYAFGTMYMKTASGNRHAINVFVNRNKEVVYWEPQTREYYHGQFHKPDLIVF